VAVVLLGRRAVVVVVLLAGVVGHGGGAGVRARSALSAQLSALDSRRGLGGAGAGSIDGWRRAAYAMVWPWSCMCMCMGYGGVVATVAVSGGSGVGNGRRRTGLGWAGAGYDCCWTDTRLRQHARLTLDIQAACNRTSWDTPRPYWPLSRVAHSHESHLLLSSIGKASIIKAPRRTAHPCFLPLLLLLPPPPPLLYQNTPHTQTPPGLAQPYTTIHQRLAQPRKIVPHVVTEKVQSIVIVATPTP
jgi:hypothetical protein